jgi:hypothetical protein
MNRKRFAAAWLASALGLASTGATAASTQADVELASGFVNWAARILAVPATPDIDAPLRDAMGRLVDEHLARLRTLLPRWIAEERARSAKPLSRDALGHAIRNRFINEVSLWRLESPGPGYDAVLTRAILKEGICDLPARESYMGVLMSFLQAVPAADRGTLLAGERALFSHWGQVRSGLPARAAKSLAEDESDVIVRLGSGEVAPDVAMPPVLASSVFKGDVLTAGGDLTCALHQWGLAHALHRGDPPGVALAAWRRATLRTAVDWSDAPATPREATAYPLAAQANKVSGTVVVLVTTDVQGHFSSASIADRRLLVPGVVGNPPIAFESLFDSASLAQAPHQFKPVAPRDDGKPAQVKLGITWKLP